MLAGLKLHLLDTVAPSPSGKRSASAAPINLSDAVYKAPPGAKLTPALGAVADGGGGGVPVGSSRYRQTAAKDSIYTLLEQFSDLALEE